MVSKKRLLFIGIGVATLIAAACGGDDDTPTRVPPTATSAPGATAMPAPTATATAMPGPTGPRGTLTIAQAELGTENYIPRNNISNEGFFWDAIAVGSIGVDRTDGQSYDFNMGSAKSVDVSVTGTDVTLTVVLRDDAPFNEGQGDISAEDLKFSLIQLAREDSRTGAAQNARNLMCNDPNTAEVVDSLTLVFHSSQDCGTGPLIEAQLFLSSAPYYSVIIPKKYFEGIGGETEYSKHAISNGSFQFVEHVANIRVVFQAVDDHWLKTPGFERVTFQKIPEEATRIANLLAGTADAALISPRSKGELDPNKTRLVRIEQSGEVFGIFGGMWLPTRDTYNPNTPWTGPDPLDPNSVKVRHAMNIAIDREAIIDTILQGEARAVGVPWLLDIPGAPWYNPQWKPYEFDPDLARQLMAEAGYPDGFTTNAYAVPLAYYPGNADVMHALANFWRQELNITINETVVEFRPILRTKLFDRTSDDLLYTYVQPSVRPPFLYFGPGCCFVSGGVLGHLATAFIDDKYNEANKEYDAIKQGAIMREIGDYIYDNYIGIPIAQTRTLIGVRSSTVGEWQPSPGLSFVHDIAWAEPTS